METVERTPSGGGWKRGSRESEHELSNGAQRRARGLGWFSIGLGLAQLTSPGGMSLFTLGAAGRRHRRTMRLFGARELATGIAILAQPRAARWLWLRVVGDLVDLGVLGSTWSARRTDKGRVLRAMFGVLGVTALDALTSVELSRQGRAYPDGVRRFTRAITVNRSPHEVYQFWRELRNLPRFMVHLDSIQVHDSRRSRWAAKGPAGTRIEWEAQITEDRPNERLSWRSLEGSEVENAGSVSFRPAPGGRGTEVVLELEYLPPGGFLGVSLAKLLGEEPSQKAASDLRRFKQVMETGEVLHSDASIHRGPHPARPLQERETRDRGGRR